MISIERSFFERFPGLASGRARSFSQPVVAMLRKVACEQRINDTLSALSPSIGFDFVERALEHFQINYRYAHNDRENIPVAGRVVIVANHPLGAFDALALLHLVGSVRRDVRMLANDVLGQIEALSSLLLPINVFGGSSTSAGRLREAYRALENEQALIVFPAGEVSRIGPQGVRDGNWSSGFVRMARQVGAPVLPVHVAASNSSTFYGVSMLARSLSSLLLAREMFGARRSRPNIVVGELVPSCELNAGSAEVVAQSMRRHVYQIGKHRPAVFPTSRAIAHPESALEVRRALRRAETIGTIGDDKVILLLDAEADCPAMREIGRLRELSFRRMGEGTGTRRDLDRFDSHYRHIILWDDQALAIMGAYRLTEGAHTLHTQGMTGLYSATLFDYAPRAMEFLTQGVELGRSFIQPAYWNSRGLDYLWQGIGAYLRHRPHLRYMFGPVSISAALPIAAREWIVHFHQHYFGDADALGIARNVFQISESIAATASELWKGHDAKAGMILLKQRLAQMDCSIPTLYKHYVDLCEPDGVRFLAFGADPAFGNCVDGLIRLDLSLMRPGKRDRYLRRAIQTSYRTELGIAQSGA